MAGVRPGRSVAAPLPGLEGRTSTLATDSNHPGPQPLGGSPHQLPEGQGQAPTRAGDTAPPEPGVRKHRRRRRRHGRVRQEHHGQAPVGAKPGGLNPYRRVAEDIAEPGLPDTVSETSVTRGYPTISD